MSFHKETIVEKSKKEHTCEACGSKIAINDNYHKHAGVYDLNFYTYKLCTQCDIIIKKEYSANGGEAIDISEHYWQIDPVAEYLPYFEKIKNKSPKIESIIERWKKD